MHCSAQAELCGSVGQIRLGVVRCQMSDSDCDLEFGFSSAGNDAASTLHALDCDTAGELDLFASSDARSEVPLTHAG